MSQRGTSQVPGNVRNWSKASKTTSLGSAQLAFATTATPKPCSGTMAQWERKPAPLPLWLMYGTSL